MGGILYCRVEFMFLSEFNFGETIHIDMEKSI